MNAKEAAGEAALQYIKSGMNVGLGTGSTTDYFLIALGREIGKGTFKNIRGVPTSIKSDKRSRELGIPLCSLNDVPYLDVAVDGADEVDPRLDLVKGLGGALLREKIIAQASKKFVVIADSSKKVTALGTHAPLPVEVTQFAHDTQPKFFKSLGCEPALRKNSDGSTFISDNGNVIYDCRFPRIDNPADLELKLLRHAGIVDTGLFIGIASVVLIAGDVGVEKLER
jgi:ribose 5-phosphate isomerase A